jgi:hypothetical protein
VRKVVESTLISADGVIGEPHLRTGEHAFPEVLRRLRGLLARLVGASPDEIILGISASHGVNDPSQPVGLCASPSQAVDLRCAGRIRAEDFPAGRRPFAVLTLQLRGIDFDGAEIGTLR